MFNRARVVRFLCASDPTQVTWIFKTKNRRDDVQKNGSYMINLENGRKIGRRYLLLKQLFHVSFMFLHISLTGKPLLKLKQWFSC